MTYTVSSGALNSTPTNPTNYETILPVRLESCGGVLSTVDMVVQRRDGPHRLRDHDDDDDDETWRRDGCCAVCLLGGRRGAGAETGTCR